MSARVIQWDWRVVRAREVIKSGVDIPFAYYATEFDLDEDEVRELFVEAAASLGLRLCIAPDPVLH
jgi:hypothetical protein